MSGSVKPVNAVRGRRRRPRRWTLPAWVALAWLGFVALAVARLPRTEGLPTAAVGVLAVASTFAILLRSEQKRWIEPLAELTAYLRSVRKTGSPPESAEFPRALGPLAAEVGALLRASQRTAEPSPTGADPQPPMPGTLLTRSGLYDATLTDASGRTEVPSSGNYSTTDMVNRLEPSAWHWIESSPAEQDFLGWPLDELRQKSFLEIVHPDDRDRVRETFQDALERGEALGLVFRIKTARGQSRSIEVNASARYGTNHVVMHLRCHVTDITAKVRAERALRIRTHELTRANEQLLQINRDLKELEAELHEKNRRLAQANDELSRKNQELDQFAHVISHDLQEPLRTLTAFSDFLLKDYGDRLEGEGREFVRHLVDASRRMRAMILGILNLSRAGEVIGEFQVVNLDDLAAVVRTDLRELTRDKGAEVRIVGPLPKVWGDRVRLGQLLTNLIANGLKYNQSPDPWVEIAMVLPAPEGGDGSSDISEPDTDPGEEVMVAIRDNGIGIDPQFHASIFQLFRRLHTREEFEGTGAGLAICRKIVEAHGGRIWVESEPGRGSTFFIRLRRPPPAQRVVSPMSAPMVAHERDHD